MSALTEMIISAIVKRGILGEIRNFRTEIEFPNEEGLDPITMVITADHVQVKIEN